MPPDELLAALDLDEHALIYNLGIT